MHEIGSCKLVKTPLDPYVLIKDDGIDKVDTLLTNVTEFQILVGKLIYLTITRLDISYIVQVLSQFMHSPSKSHLRIAIRLLRFSKNNLGKGVSVIIGNTLFLKGFVDAD